MRRLPLYLLIDTSGSMRGEPIAALQNGIDVLLAMLRADPYALESVWLSVITFDRDVCQILPLTPIDAVKMPVIATPDSGPTHTGAALDFLLTTLDRDLQKTTPNTKGDWQPLLLLFTDGNPSDLQRYRAAIPAIQQYGFANIIACAAGAKADSTLLLELTPNVVSLDIADSSTFKPFFKWVSANVATNSQSIGAAHTNITLAPPPPEVHIVI